MPGNSKKDDKCTGLKNEENKTDITSVTPESQQKTEIGVGRSKKGNNKIAIDGLKNKNENPPITRLRDNKRRIQKMNV